MVKLIVCYRRKPGMEVEAFQHHLQNVHAPLLINLPATRKYLKKYIQSHTVPEAYTSAVEGTDQANAAPFDGASEFWFEKLEDASLWLNDPEIVEKVRPDEENFIDHSSLIWFVTQEKTIIG